MLRSRTKSRIKAGRRCSALAKGLCEPTRLLVQASSSYNIVFAQGPHIICQVQVLEHTPLAADSRPPRCYRLAPTSAVRSIKSINQADAIANTMTACQKQAGPGRHMRLRTTYVVSASKSRAIESTSSVYRIRRARSSNRGTTELVVVVVARSQAAISPGSPNSSNLQVPPKAETNVKSSGTSEATQVRKNATCLTAAPAHHASLLQTTSYSCPAAPAQGPIV